MVVVDLDWLHGDWSAYLLNLGLLRVVGPTRPLTHGEVEPASRHLFGVDIPEVEIPSDSMQLLSLCEFFLEASWLSFSGVSGRKSLREREDNFLFHSLIVDLAPVIEGFSGVFADSHNLPPPITSLTSVGDSLFRVGGFSHTGAGAYSTLMFRGTHLRPLRELNPCGQTLQVGLH